MSQESQVSVSRKYMSGTRSREDNAGYDTSAYV